MVRRRRAWQSSTPPTLSNSSRLRRVCRGEGHRMFRLGAAVAGREVQTMAERGHTALPLPSEKL